MRRSTLRAVMLIAAAILGWSRVALAEAELVEVRYGAPAGCSSRDAFVRELAARTARVRVVAAAEAEATFVVELQDRSNGVVGQLRWLEPDAAETARAVSGATCEEVVSALALIAAVLVDPASLTRSPTSPQHAALPIPPERPEPWRLRPTFGVGARVATVYGPGWSLGPGLELGLEAEHGGKRGPAASVALERLAPRTKSTRAGDADFATTLGRLTLCPLRFPTTGALFVAPCAAFEVGSMHASGSRTLGRHEVSVLWLAADPVASFAYRPLRILSLDLELLGVFPLVHDRFYFGPSPPFFSIPIAGFSARAGLRVIWP